MKHPDILQLLGQLKSEHKENLYLYRGQRKRHSPHRWIVKQETREVEGLYPGDFRFNYQIKEFTSKTSDKNMNLITAARAHGRIVRDQFFSFLFVELFLSKGEQKTFSWAREQFPDLINMVKDRKPLHNIPFYRIAWSLAQHYAISTALTDLTFSPDIAAWFATEPWDPEGKRMRAGEPGVIYRFHRSKLEEIIAIGNVIEKKMSMDYNTFQTPELFLVDIRDIPTFFARRPASQYGASLYGFDRAHIIEAATRSGAIEVFEFIHKPGLDIGIHREDVIPSEDPFLIRLKRFNTFCESLSPKIEGSENMKTETSKLLDIANTTFKMGIITAHKIKKIQLTDQVFATVFDQIKRRGKQEFRYLMIAENEAMKTILFAITAEPMKLEPGLLPTVLKSSGYGTMLLRMWDSFKSMALQPGNWETIAEFIESSAAVAKKMA